ncbi:MAG: hypothetical protein WA143_00195 [Lutibacter sp.]
MRISGKKVLKVPKVVFVFSENSLNDPIITFRKMKSIKNTVKPSIITITTKFMELAQKEIIPFPTK